MKIKRKSVFIVGAVLLTLALGVWACTAMYNDAKVKFENQAAN